MSSGECRGKPKQEPGAIRQEEAAAVEQGAGSDRSGTGGGEPGAGRDVSSEGSGTLWDIIKDSTLSEKIRGYLPTIRKALVTSVGALALAVYATTVTTQAKHPPKATGLWPSYPLEVSCPIITSSFADTTDLFRDERSKPHSGVDITVEEGTEILAAADGLVIAKYKTANGSWVLTIQHNPFDTGLRDYYTYSAYGHIQKKTPVEAGQVVKRGQVIAYSGETGTFYPHLHLTTLASPDSVFELSRQKFLVTNGSLIDPLLFMSGTLIRNRIPNKKVTIRYQSEDSYAKIRWPLRCKGELKLLELRLSALALAGSNKFDGAWEGSLRCGECKNCPGPLEKRVNLNIANGKFDIVPDTTYKGKGVIDSNGNMRIRWSPGETVWGTQSERIFSFDGKYDGESFKLEGQRGPRKCTFELSRATSPVGASN